MMKRHRKKRDVRKKRGREIEKYKGEKEKTVEYKEGIKKVREERNE